MLNIVEWDGNHEKLGMIQNGGGLALSQGRIPCIKRLRKNTKVF